MWLFEIHSNFSMAQNQSVSSCHEPGKLFCDCGSDMYWKMYTNSSNNLYPEAYREAVFAKVIVEHAPL